MVESGAAGLGYRAGVRTVTGGAMKEMTDLAYEIERLEQEIAERSERLAEHKRQLPQTPVSDYTLTGPDGPVKLSHLFGEGKDLIVIHNMGKGCRYCTLWADGWNGILPHIENRAAFVVVTPDSPDTQAQVAHSRGWKFRMISSHGSTFTEDMGFRSEKSWLPGVSTFYKNNDGSIIRVARAGFGPFDTFCSAWHLFGLLKDGVNGWEPKYRYGA